MEPQSRQRPLVDDNAPGFPTADNGPRRFKRRTGPQHPHPAHLRPHLLGYDMRDVSHLKPGDTAGLIALMETYGYVGVKATDTVRAIVMTRADKRKPVEVASVPLTQ